MPPGSTVSKPSKVKVWVEGTVSDGIEPGCRVLRSKGVVYVLIWRDGTLVTGQQVSARTVEGTLQPGLATTCQQGTPLLVERVLNQ